VNGQSSAQPVLQLRQTRACCVLMQHEKPEYGLSDESMA